MFVTMPVFSRPQEGDIVVPPILVDCWAGLNIAGIVLLLVLVCTILFSRKSSLHRDPTLINAFIVLILVNTVNIIYYLANNGNIGVWESVHRPDLTLCKVQAVILAGSQPAQAAGVLALCLRLWLTTIQLSVPWFNNLRGPAVLTFLLALPYLCIIGFVPAMAISISQKHPEFSPTPFYCATLEDDLRSGYQNLALGFSCVALLIEFHLIYLVTRHFRHTSQAAQAASTSIHTSFGIDARLQPERSIKIFFFVRVAIFISWTLLMIAATLYQAFDSTILDPNSDMLFACVAPVAFLCFATQPDVLRAWRIPGSADEWRALFSKKAIPAEAAPTDMRHLTGDLGWADFLGSTSPDTIYSIDTELDEQEKRSRLESESSVKRPRPKGVDTLDRVSEERAPSLVVTLGRRQGEAEGLEQADAEDKSRDLADYRV